MVGITITVLFIGWMSGMSTSIATNDFADTTNLQEYRFGTPKASTTK